MLGFIWGLIALRGLRQLPSWLSYRANPERKLHRPTPLVDYQNSDSFFKSFVAQFSSTHVSNSDI